MRVVVIGGGVAGLSAAAALSDDAHLTVLEAEDALGYHTSGRSAAMFEENYGNDVVRALNRASRTGHEAADVLSPRGLMMAVLPEERTAFERDLAQLGMTEIPVDAARDRVPILAREITRAALHEDAMDIDTDRLLQCFARRVRTAGGQIVTGARVDNIAGPDPWRVSACGQVYEADVLVNAAGAWADELAGLAGVAPIGLTPYRRSMARMPAPGGHDVRAWPMLFGPGETWYAKPDAGSWLVSPAEEDPVPPQDAWADDMVLAEGIARYQSHVSEEVTRLETSWAGLRTFAPDRALVLGEDPEKPGFFWCAGQGGYGFQTAHGAAALLAASITGRASDLPAEVSTALSPARFRA